MQRVERPVMTMGMERIAAKARQQSELQFTSLAHHITETLIWESLNAIPNGSAPGCDGQSVGGAKENFKVWAPPMLQAICHRGYGLPRIQWTRRRLRPALSNSSGLTPPK